MTNEIMTIYGDDPWGRAMDSSIPTPMSWKAALDAHEMRGLVPKLPNGILKLMNEPAVTDQECELEQEEGEA